MTVDDEDVTVAVDVGGKVTVDGKDNKVTADIGGKVTGR